MSKTAILVCLDSSLVSQIRAALPNTRFKSVEAAIADVVVDGITGSYSAWTKLVTWEPEESEEEPIAATEITSDRLHELADTAYSTASEILGICDAIGASTAEAKAELRIKVLEIHLLAVMMREHVGLPSLVSDAPPIPPANIADIPRNLAKMLNPIISTDKEETMLNAGALAAFVTDALVITANEGVTGADHAYLLGWAIKAALDYEAGR